MKHKNDKTILNNQFLKMKVKIFKDINFEVDFDRIANVLNSVVSHITFEFDKEEIKFKENCITPTTYLELPKNIKRDSEDFFLVLIFTNDKYYNNFFFDTDNNIFIISFSDWNKLTDISKSIGVIFFITSILCDEMHIGDIHDESIGCINDFWMDKTKIDVGMRSAYICKKCKSDFLKRTPNKLEEQILSDITKLLDLVSHHSRTGKDILDIDLLDKKHDIDLFDVFLCHNSRDKPAIRRVACELRKIGIKTWLDEEQIQPGKLWQVVLEENISKIHSALVFVGENNTGPWQDMEIRAFLSEFANRGCSVIPVILEECTNVPNLPLFLRQMMWIDMRKQTPDPYKQMKWGITGNQ